MSGRRSLPKSWPFEQGRAHLDMLSEKSGLLRIAKQDNVFVLLRPLSAGERLRLCGRTVVCDTPLGLGHKIAARDIAAGEKIVKYGAPIGSAVRDIALGEHVHLHNIQSDYIPTYTLERDPK